MGSTRAQQNSRKRRRRRPAGTAAGPQTRAPGPRALAFLAVGRPFRGCAATRHERGRCLWPCAVIADRVRCLRTTCGGAPRRRAARPSAVRPCHGLLLRQHPLPRPARTDNTSRAGAVHSGTRRARYDHDELSCRLAEPMHRRKMHRKSDERGGRGLIVEEHAAAFLAVPHKSQAEREFLNSIFQSF